MFAIICNLIDAGINTIIIKPLERYVSTYIALWYERGFCPSLWPCETLLSYTKVYLLLDKKHHIIARNRWADTDLDFFYGTNMLVRRVYHSFYGTPEFGTRELSSAYIFVVCFLLTYSLFHLSPSSLESRSLTSTCRFERRNISVSDRTANVDKILDC